jgi:hypothetical protein
MMGEIVMLVDIPNLTDQINSLMRVVKFCYEYSFLRGRKQAGLVLSKQEEIQLTNLAQLLEEKGPHAKRSHKRMPVLLPVVLKTSAGLRQATMLNISGNGMYVATSEHLEQGAKIQVRVGKIGQVEYSFPCCVKRVASENGGGVGLQIDGIPLEVRFG